MVVKDDKEPIGVTLYPVFAVIVWGTISVVASLMGGGKIGAIFLLSPLPLLMVALVWVVALTRR